MKEIHLLENNYLLSAIQQGDQRHLMHCFGDIIRHCAPTAIASSIWKMRKKLCRILFYGFGKIEKI